LIRKCAKTLLQYIRRNQKCFGEEPPDPALKGEGTREERGGEGRGGEEKKGEGREREGRGGERE